MAADDTAGSPGPGRADEAERADETRVGEGKAPRSEAEQRYSRETKPTRPCVICGKPQQAAVAPFCSARCRDRDLNRWLSGAYAIPGTEDARDDAAIADNNEGDET